MKYISIFLLVFAASYTLSFSQPRYSVDPDKPWAVECQQRVESRVKNHESDVDQVIVLGDSLMESRLSNSEKRLEGSGKYIKESGKWKNFTFECIYNTRDEEVSSVSYDKVDKSSGYGDYENNGTDNKAQGECKLWNTKENYVDMEGLCKVVLTRTSDGKEYIVTFNNGKEFRFVKQGPSYRVRMPKEWSDHPGYVTNTGSNTTFEWGKWKLIFKEY